MEEMRVYIANLGKYVEGELKGAWFTLPIDFDEVAEKVGLNNEYEEYAIHDYELPFDIGEYCSIDELNSMYEAVEEIAEPMIVDNLRAVMGRFGLSSVEEVAEHADDMTIYSCDSMEDLAAELVDEGCFGEVPEPLHNYIDYEAIARDMEIEGFYLEVSGGIINCAM